MKRFELYETLEEADGGFKEFCDSHTGCNGCPFKLGRTECQIAWLFQEVELEPCPFCGHKPYKIEKVFRKSDGKAMYAVRCVCSALGQARISPIRAVLYWNRRANAAEVEKATEEWNKRFKAPEGEVTE